MHAPPMACCKLRQPVSTQLWSRHDVVLIDREKLINKDFMIGIFDGTTSKLPPLQEYINSVFDNKQGSLVIPAKNKTRFCHGIYCDINCFILLVNILSILTYFVLNLYAMQRQYSESSSGKSGRPYLSTYIQLVGRIA